MFDLREYAVSRGLIVRDYTTFDHSNGCQKALVELPDGRRLWVSQSHEINDLIEHNGVTRNGRRATWLNE